jgi:excisionase family DNA binding protein
MNTDKLIPRRLTMKELLTVKEVAEMLGYHPNTIYILMRDGKLKSKKVFGRVYVPREEIEKITGGNSETDGSLCSD